MDARSVTRYRPNVWLLTSIATQADADRNIPELLQCRELAPVLGVSAEPLLGPVDFSTIPTAKDVEAHALTVRGNAAHEGPGTHREQTAVSLRDPKGGDPSEWPEDLRVREFPCVEARA